MSEDNQPQPTLADLIRVYQRAQQFAQDPASDPAYRAARFQDAGTYAPGYELNPWRRDFVQGGIGLRSLFGMDPTEKQRLEDAFMQFPPRRR